MAQSFWLINSNRSEVRRFIKNTANKDRFFEYMFVDSGKIVGVLGKEPPVMTKRKELKIDNIKTLGVYYLKLNINNNIVNKIIIKQ